MAQTPDKQDPDQIKVAEDLEHVADSLETLAGSLQVIAQNIKEGQAEAIDVSTLNTAIASATETKDQRVEREDRERLLWRPMGSSTRH